MHALIFTIKDNSFSLLLYMLLKQGYQNQKFSQLFDPKNCNFQLIYDLWNTYRTS